MKIPHRFALATAIASLAASLNVAMAAPVTYGVEPTHTYPRLSYSHFGFSKQILRFNKTSGKVVLDQAAKTGSVEVSIDMNSIDTGHKAFDEEIVAEDFFHTEKFPTATFKSSKVRFVGGKPSHIDGLLTIKGITKPLTLVVSRFKSAPHPFLQKDALGANAHARIKRSDFNAGKYAPGVSDEVDLDITIEAIKE